MAEDMIEDLLIGLRKAIKKCSNLMLAGMFDGKIHITVTEIIKISQKKYNNISF